MTDEALHAALARLDQAISRVERAAAARETSGVGIAAAYARLEERHGLLRARVEETVARLDMMIGDDD